MEKQVSVTQLLEKFNRKALKKISSRLIEAYKNQDRRVLNRYAEKLQIDNSEYQNRFSLLFKKLIFAYHPDRIYFFHKHIENLHQKGDVASLWKLMADEEIDPYRYTMDPVSEQYSYTWEDSPDDFMDGARVGTFEQEEYGFIEAVRNSMYGNLFADFLPKDLYYLDGMLDLSGEGIEDLSGMEYCTNITGLNLEGNRISHLYPIEDLVNLDTLYLSRNSIEYIDALAGLSGLKVLDLSFNEIENIEPLYSLPYLEFVNLAGNRGISEAQLKILKERCMVII